MDEKEGAYRQRGGGDGEDTAGIGGAVVGELGVDGLVRLHQARR